MGTGYCVSRGAQGSWPGSGPEPPGAAWGAVPCLGTTRGVIDDLMLQTVAFARGFATGTHLTWAFSLISLRELLIPFLKDSLSYPFGDKGGL